MNTTHERVIREVVGRMADEAPPAPEPEQLGIPVVPSSTSRPGRVRGWLVAATLVGMLALVGYLVWDDDGEAPVAAGEAVASTLVEFREALSTATDAFDAALHVQVVQHGYVEDHLAVSTWTSRRESGNVAVIQTVDVEVRDVPWWLMGDEPRNVGTRLTTTAQVNVDQVLYAASAGVEREAWHIGDDLTGDLTAFPLGVANINLLGMMLDELESGDTEVTRRALPGGGEEWLMTYADEAGTGWVEARIGPDGFLSSIRGEGARGEREPTDTRSPIDSWTSTYRVLDDPAPIPVPEVGAPFDPAPFDLPDDFPIGSG